MKAWALALLLLTACCTPPKPSPEPVEVTVKRATVILDFVSGGYCSGTYTEPTVIITSSHCFSGDDQILTGNSTPLTVVSILHDGIDAARVEVQEPSPHWVKLGPEPVQGEPVFMHGNPEGMRDMFRRGYVAGLSDRGWLLDMTVGRGDSGAGIFNSRGELIGILAGIAHSDPWHMAVVRPFADGFPPQAP